MSTSLQIDRISFIHEENIIHGDIKPSNFMVSEKEDSTLLVHLVDFGSSFEYPSMEPSEFLGAIPFASVNCLLRLRKIYFVISTCSLD
jgi:serine/threonine protein kinase